MMLRRVRVERGLDVGRARVVVDEGAGVVPVVGQAVVAAVENAGVGGDHFQELLGERIVLAVQDTHVQRPVTEHSMWTLAVYANHVVHRARRGS